MNVTFFETFRRKHQTKRIPLPAPESFTVGVFSFDGSHARTESTNVADLEVDPLNDFIGQFKYLSGDMELPLEDKPPGPFDFMEYRISADANCGLMFFYFHDEVVFASVFLTGREPETEAELLDTFRYLLMETDDMAEDPTEEEIDEKLSSDNFPFSMVAERPAAIEIEFPSKDDELQEIKHAQNMNRHAAAAFFQSVLK